MARFFLSVVGILFCSILHAQHQLPVRLDDPFYNQYKAVMSKYEPFNRAITDIILKNIDRFKTDSVFKDSVNFVLRNNEKKVLDTENEFIRQFPGSIISYDLIRKHLRNSNDPVLIDSMLGRLSPELLQRPEIVPYVRNVEKMKGLEVGNLAPDFTLLDSSGRQVRLSQFRGKYVLLDFWASWCVFCRKENPNLIKAYNNYDRKDFTVLGISIDLKDSSLPWKQAIIKDKLTWPQVWDQDKAVANQYFINAIPRNFLLDPNGVIIARDVLGEDLQDTLQHLLGIPVPEIKNGALGNYLIDQATKFSKLKSADEVLHRFHELMKFYPFEKNKDIYFAYEMVYNDLTMQLIAYDHPASLDYLPLIKGNFIRRWAMTNIPHQLLSKNRGKEALEILETQLKISKPKIDSSQIFKEDYYVYSTSYSKLLDEMGKNKKALKFYEEVRKNGFAKSDDIPFYALLLMKNKKYNESMKIMESLAKEGIANNQIKESLKTMWLKKHKNGDFDEYMLSLTDSLRFSIVKQMDKFRKNFKAPQFRLLDLNGIEVDLNKLTGKVVFIDFWATWCGPCIASFPAMQKAVDKYKDNPDVVFLFIDSWEKETNYEKRKKEVQAFIESRGHNFQVLLDVESEGEYEVISKFGVQGIPAKFLIGRDGNVKYQFSGFSGGTDATFEELDYVIKDVLKQ